MARVRLWMSGVLGVLLLVVLFQNLGSTVISVLFWSWELPLILVMAAFAAVGALLGALGTLAMLARRGAKGPA